MKRGLVRALMISFSLGKSSCQIESEKSNGKGRERERGELKKEKERSIVSKIECINLSEDKGNVKRRRKIGKKGWERRRPKRERENNR